MIPRQWALTTKSYPFLPGMDGVCQILSVLKIYEKSRCQSRRRTLKSALAHLHCIALKTQLPVKQACSFFRIMVVFAFFFFLLKLEINSNGINK